VKQSCIRVIQAEKSEKVPYGIVSLEGLAAGQRTRKECTGNEKRGTLRIRESCLVFREVKDFCIERRSKKEEVW